MKQIALHSLTVKPSISGKTVRRLVRNKSPQHKGAIPAKLVAGVWPYQLSEAEAAHIVGTHLRVVHQALGYLPNNKPLPDGAIDPLINRVGAERVWAALDRPTQPPLPLIAEAAE